MKTLKSRNGASGLTLLETMEEIKKRIVVLAVTAPNIGSRVGNGKFQLVNVVFNDKGTSTETPLSDWLVFDEFINYLDNLI